MNRVAWWSIWSVTWKVQLAFALLGTLVPLVALGICGLSESGPDGEGAWWPFGAVAYFLLLPGTALCRAWSRAGEPGFLAVFLANGIFFLLLGSVAGWLERTKRSRAK